MSQPQRSYCHAKTDAFVVIKSNYTLLDRIRFVFNFLGQGKFDVPFLEPALQYCTHLIYGYAGISDETFKLVPLNEHFDVTKDNYRAITNLKRRYPGLRVLLSVGGNEDLNGDDDDKNLKYRTLVSEIRKLRECGLY